jgi:hypothetical protein
VSDSGHSSGGYLIHRLRGRPRHGILSFHVLFCCVVFSTFCDAAPHSASPSVHETTSADAAPPVCRIVYAGFVGAMETSNHKHSGVVQIRDTLRGPGYEDVCAESFMPISWASGRDWILTHFPSHDGPLTAEEIAAGPRVILVGHSTGGWAMFSVARDLRDKAIPVELTVQVDSVGLTDSTVPRNVKTCAIFHAWDVLMFMTTKRIRMEDPLHTKLLANVLVKHASHLSITRDPRIREFVLNAVAEARGEMASRPAVPVVEPKSSALSPAGGLAQPN